MSMNKLFEDLRKMNDILGPDTFVSSGFETVRRMILELIEETDLLKKEKDCYEIILIISKMLFEWVYWFHRNRRNTKLPKFEVFDFDKYVETNNITLPPLNV